MLVLISLAVAVFFSVAAVGGLHLRGYVHPIFDVFLVWVFLAVGWLALRKRDGQRGKIDARSA
jgi:hypothetical protein